ncbi:MAG: metal-dependent hydrolase, partial [Alphaproteobacteria bacterium]|nr:metal-dependent hydrolase [Alphaproteobacteria bacterium]
TIGGILPDIDSDSGKPLSLIFGKISVLLPALLLGQLTTVESFSSEFLVSYFVCSYFIINYLICGLVKKITVHRGIIHSLPFSILSGEIGYLLFATSEENVAIIVGGAMFAGCLVHLILDELHSFTFKYKIFPVLKKSSGTALKFKSDSPFASAALYCLIIIAAIIISFDYVPFPALNVETLSALF